MNRRDVVTRTVPWSPFLKGVVFGALIAAEATAMVIRTDDIADITLALMVLMMAAPSGVCLLAALIQVAQARNPRTPMWTAGGCAVGAVMATLAIALTIAAV